MPEPEDGITEDGYRLTVLALEDRHVSRVRIERLPEKKASENNDAKSEKQSTATED